MPMQAATGEKLRAAFALIPLSGARDSEWRTPFQDTGIDRNRLKNYHFQIM